MIRALLASNSTNPGGGYLDHVEDATRAHFDGCERVAFVPYALADLDGYADVARRRFGHLGLELVSVHDGGDPRAVLEQSDGVFVGGGNTFRLLDRLVRHGLVEEVRSKVAAGAPYMGASAGSNVACPTIMTTNDMPIVELASFQALGLVDFQINPHYIDRGPDVSHGGETRAQRIAEYHEEHQAPVIGLREGSWLDVDGTDVALAGPRPAVLFLPGREPADLSPGPIAYELTSMNDT